MDIDAPYACLLGHTWVHMAEEILLLSRQGDKSTRNQKGTIMAQTSVAPYEEARGELYECLPRVFETDSVKKPQKDTLKAMQVMKRYGWTEGQGLGKNAQSMKEIPAGGAQSLGFGLGFEATSEGY
ncbi:hypothetical protein COLO4_08169 [Corchorus olitorius]|uniref:G-patch domain-containing protein n=1 Tax=Corchorus olitorius TaxID=93759 RepID=A0A1R3KH08_9ROSI|nr:hypothetical protein COLO4_08169 [Corchorus olitorius]